jgi:hypothetical protein
MKFANIEEAFSRQLFLQAGREHEQFFAEAFFTFLKITEMEEVRSKSVKDRSSLYFLFLVRLLPQISSENRKSAYLRTETYF